MRSGLWLQREAASLDDAHASSKSSRELHAKAACVVFRIVGIEALAVRYVHSHEHQGQVLHFVQSIGKSGADPKHELIAGSARGKISVVEEHACAPLHRSRHVPASPEPVL